MKSVMLPKVLKTLMTERKTSPKEVARDTGIPLSTIQSYLSGKKATYSADHLLKLASYFEVSLDFLMTSVENPRAQLNSVPTEGLFEGWLKVRIERAIPSKSTKKPEDD